MGLFNSNRRDEKKDQQTMRYSLMKIGQALYNIFPRTATVISYTAVRKGNSWDQKMQIYMTRDIAHEKPVPDKDFDKKFNISKEQIKSIYADTLASIEYAERNLKLIRFNYVIINLTYDGYIQWRYGYSKPSNVNGFTTNPIISLSASNADVDGMNFSGSNNINNF